MAEDEFCVIVHGIVVLAHLGALGTQSLIMPSQRGKKSQNTHRLLVLQGIKLIVLILGSKSLRIVVLLR